VGTTKEQELRRCFAKGDPEDLLRLAADPDIPLDLLHTLATSYPNQVASNPLWPLLLTASPDVLATFPQDGLCALLGCDEGDWLLPIAAASLTAEVRLEVARCARETPPLAGLLSRLARDPAPWVRAQIAHREDTLADALERLATDEEPEIRARIALNASTPIHLLRTLLADPEDDVREAVTHHPSFPLLLRWCALEGSPSERLVAAADPTTPRDALEHLLRDSTPQVAQTASRTLAFEQALEPIIEGTSDQQDEPVRSW